MSARAPRPSLNDSEEEDFREAGPEGNGSNSPFPGDREWTEPSLLDSSAEWEDRAAVARAVCSAPPGARLRPRAGRAALNRRGLAADGARDRVQEGCGVPEDLCVELLFRCSLLPFWRHVPTLVTSSASSK